MIYIQTLEELAQIKAGNVIGFDTEGTSLDPYENRLLLISIFTDTMYVIDCVKIPPRDVLQYLKPILQDPKIIKVGHNLVYDYKIVYHNSGVEIQGIHDTMIVDRMLWANSFLPPGNFTLQGVASRRLGIDVEKSVRESFLTFADEEFTSEQLEYSGNDAKVVVDIYHKQLPEIKAKNLQKIYNLEMAIIPPTAMMEYLGVYVDKEQLGAMIEPFTRYINRVDHALQEMLIRAGGIKEIVFSRDGYTAINTSSQKQVLEAFNAIGINIKNLNAKTVQGWELRQKKKTATFDYSSVIEDEDVVDALDQYPGIKNEYLRAYGYLKGLRILLSTFVIGIHDSVNTYTGRVHPHYNSYGAMATGRYSSSKPNWQNNPRDDKLERLGLKQYSIRSCIKAPDGKVLIIADFSGIELVILAALSGDQKLLDEIIKGDVHLYVAKNVLGCADITSKNKKTHPYSLWRNGAKRVSYSIAYGTTGRNLSETLNIDLASVGYRIDTKQGDDLIAAWYGLFPDTARYLESNALKAVSQGFVTDTWGRRRNWDLDLAIDKWRRLAIMREGKNMPIQSTSATMTKRAIQLLWRKLDRKQANVIITVHDELVLESTKKYADRAVHLTKMAMEQAIRDTLPNIEDLVGEYESLSVTPSISNCYDK